MSTYFDQLDTTAKTRYKEKLSFVQLSQCPYSLPNDVWEDNVKLWPPVEFPSIYMYLINTPGKFTLETMKAYKSMEAYNYFISGWVDTCYLYKVNRDIHIFKAKVLPSQRINESPHNPWVAVHKDGTILTAHCTCMAG